MRPRPGGRDEGLGPRHRARVEGAVGEIIAELVPFVGDHQHVVTDALRKACNLGLDREMPGIGAARARDKGPRFLLNDTCLEFQRGMVNVAREFPIAVAMAHHQQQVLPPLRDQVLDQSIGEHRVARQQMQNVGAAILAAQAIACRARIEESDPHGLRHSGRGH